MQYKITDVVRRVQEETGAGTSEAHSEVSKIIGAAVVFADPKHRPQYLDLIVKGKDGGYTQVSTKNLLKIDLRKFAMLASIGAISVGSMISQPWLIPFVLIVFWGELRDKSTNHLTPTTATVFNAFLSESMEFEPMNQEKLENILAKNGQILESSTLSAELIQLCDLGVIKKMGNHYFLIDELEIEQ